MFEILHLNQEAPLLMFGILQMNQEALRLMFEILHLNQETIRRVCLKYYTQIKKPFVLLFNIKLK